jgi:uncharacterized membrane protein YbhN (UPF0104 family)
MRAVRESWRRWSWLLGVAVLAVVLRRTGVDPFVAGIRAVDWWTLALGAALAVPATLACAWRWRLVARGVGVDVAPGGSIASCYRSQFLNSTLPGGVLGDLHRGVRHGRAVGDTGGGLRSVFWERTAGQVVQATITVAVLLLLPSPLQPSIPALGVLAGCVVVLGTLALRRLPAVGPSWPAVATASAVALAGHLATYVVAARAVGVTAPVTSLMPLALLVLLAAGLPTNVAGWGPREGMAAWAFAAAGLGAQQGVATAVAYGTIALVASLPGALLLVAPPARGAVAHTQVAPAGRGARA